MANKVSFIIQLKNQFSANAEKFKRSFSGIEKSIKKSSASLSAFSAKAKASMGELGSRARRTGAIMTAAVTLPLALLSNKLVNASSDATETGNKFNTVFSSVRAEANKTANEFSKSFGVAGSTARKLIGDTGDLLTGFGFTGDAALEMSKKVNELAADLASFQNLEGGTARASEALTKALLGETESAKSLGIVIRQLDPAFKAQVKMLMRTKRVTQQQAKAMAILTLAQKQSFNAVGDVARTWKDYASVQRRNTEEAKMLAEAYGTILLPVFAKLRDAASKAMIWLTGLSPRMKKLVVVAVAFVAIGGPLLLLLGSIAGAFALMSFAMLPIAAAILGLIAVGALLYLNWGDVVGGLTAIWQNFSDFITGIFGSMGDTFSLLWEGRFLDSLKSALNIGIKLINQFLEPLNFARDIAGLSAIKIPEFKISADDAALKSVSAPSAPSSSMNGQFNGQITVAAAAGTTIKETKMKSSGSNLNIGMNMMGGY